MNKILPGVVFFLMAFLGVMLLKGFDTRISLFDLSIGLLAALSGSLLYIIIRKIGDDDHPLVILHYFMLVAVVTSGVACIPYWVTPNATDGLGLLLIGVVGFFAQLFFTSSIQAPDDQVSFLAILRYVEVLFALASGYLFFDETYSIESFIGIFLIFTSLILSFRLKTKMIKKTFAS